VKKGERQYIHELGDQELLERIVQEELMYQKSRFRHSVSAIENPLSLRQMRRNIARLKTELRRRQMKTAQNNTADGTE
jgi:large subunit ribosomal protein L29